MINIKPWDQRLAYILVKPLKNTKIHPNHLTTATLVLGSCSALLFALKGGSFAWLAALLYMLAVFSDHMDGELARMAGKTSGFSHHYDYIVGGINYTVLIYRDRLWFTKRYRYVDADTWSISRIM